MPEPRVVGGTPPASVAMNDLREGVEKYIAHLETCEPMPASQTVQLAYANPPRQWQWWASVRIDNHDSYMRETRIANARNILIAGVRDVVRVEKPSAEQLDHLESALKEYDKAREAP